MLLSINMVAQEKVREQKVVTRELPVYRDVDVLASYRGGYDVLVAQIKRATKHCRRGKSKKIKSKIIVDILITDKGKVARVDFVVNETNLCVNEILATIEKSAQWIPGRIEDRPVNSFLQLTINLDDTYRSNG